jgi:uncharacterized membrane protein
LAARAPLPSLVGNELPKFRGRGSKSGGALALTLIHVKAAPNHHVSLIKKIGCQEDVMWWDWNYWPMPHFFVGPLFMIVFVAICMIMMMWMMRSQDR